MATIDGTNNSETLIGTAGDDTITGKGGGDGLTGNGGADTFRYVLATDSTASAYDIISDFDSRSSSGHDTLDLSAVTPTAISVIVGDSSSVVFADTPGGKMQIGIVGTFIPSAISTGRPDFGVFVAGTGTATYLFGGLGNDTVVGTSGDNIITGGLGGDVLYGGAGKDTFIYEGFADSSPIQPDLIADFVSTTDKIQIQNSATTTVTVVRNGALSSVFANSAFGGLKIDVGGQLYGAANAVGASDDISVVGFPISHVTILGDDLGDVISAERGKAEIFGGSGADTIHGGRSADFLSGGGGNDAIESGWNDFSQTTNQLGIPITVAGDSGSNTLFGGAGNDSLSGGSSDYMDGGGGNDSITVGRGGIIPGLGPVAIGAVALGGDGDDSIRSFGRQGVIGGGDGNDTIRLSFAESVPYDTAPSRNVLTGGSGADSFFFDAAVTSSPTDPSLITDFATGIDKLTLPANGDFSIVRSGGSSFVFGADGMFHMQIDFLTDVNGSDLQGLSKGVFLLGDSGINTLSASPMGDTLQGQAGADRLVGGAGADVFRYGAASDSTTAAFDIISGFTPGVDKIDLRIVHTGAADTFGVASNGTSSFVFVDLGGDGTADMTIAASGTPNLTANDVLFGVIA